MFGSAIAVLFGVVLVAWIVAAVVYAVKKFGEGYGPRSFFRF